jgi:hypothetical protein
MRRAPKILIPLLAFVLLISVFAAPSAFAAKKGSGYNAQIHYTFANGEQVAPQGLVVALSAEATVVTDAEGAAGPFRNVRGNGTAKITLTNASTPITAAGGENSSVELVFRTQKKKLAVSSWWWIDERGKRIGQKQKG